MKSFFAVAAFAAALGVSLSPALAESTQFLAALNGGHESAAVPGSSPGMVYGTAGDPHVFDSCYGRDCRVAPPAANQPGVASNEAVAGTGRNSR